jgi:hypothetical protein
MLLLIMLAMLTGVLLGLRFPVFVLAPVAAGFGLLVIVLGQPAFGTALSPLTAIVATSISLQMSYLAGLLMRHFLVVTRLPTRGIAAGPVKSRA